MIKHTIGSWKLILKEVLNCQPGFRMHSEHNNPDEVLASSNGGTAVFLSVLVLSGVKVSTRKKEKERKIG